MYERWFSVGHTVHKDGVTFDKKNKNNKKKFMKKNSK